MCATDAGCRDMKTRKGNEMNKNIGKHASKGGKAWWNSLSKQKRVDRMRRMGIISAATRKLKKQLKPVDSAI